MDERKKLNFRHHTQPKEHRLIDSLSTDAKKFFTWFLGGVVIPLMIIPYLYQIYLEPSAKEKAAHKEELITLRSEIRYLSFKDDETYQYCLTHQNANTDISPTRLDEINQDRNKALEKLVNHVAGLYDQNIISITTYNAIKTITAWNNKLFLAGKNVCDLPLSTSKQSQQWRNQILSQIELPR